VYPYSFRLFIPIFLLPPNETEKSVKSAALLLCIQEFPSSNLGQETCYLGLFFVVFQSLCGDGGVVNQIRRWYFLPQKQKNNKLRGF
jgi:hypothetical protein